MAKTSEAQIRANTRWKNKNKEKQRKYQYKSYAKSYIRNMTNTEDLNQLCELIDERRKELNN